MKKLITACMCVLAMMFLCPVSVMAETEAGILVLPEDDGTEYPVRGISSGYNHNEEVYEVTVPENIIRLGDEVFLGNTNLSEIQLHSKLQKIGKDAFLGTAYYDNPENWEEGVLYIEDCLIAVDRNKIGDTYEIRPGTRLIASGAFEHCKNLNKIVIPDTIEYVGEDAFANTGFYNDQNNWNHGVLELDYLLLKVAEDYTGVLEVKDGIRTIADGAAQACWEITEVITPESLVHIGLNAFSNCSNLEEINLGKNVETLGRGPFYRCLSLEDIVVDEQNEHFQVVDGILFNEELTSVVKCPQQITGSVIIPSTVSVINAYSFENCGTIAEVMIPQNCVFIGRSAFSGCESLRKLTIPENMEYIDHYAFEECENLREILIPDNVTYLGKSAFSNCKALEIAVIGEGVTALKQKLFSGCGNLTYVELGDNITEIAYTAFEDTKYICNVRNYKDGLLVASKKYLMKIASDVVECEIPDGVEVIADGAFEYVIESKDLEKIYIPKSLKSYNWYAFHDVLDDVKICYEGTAEKFAEIAGYGWEQINLVTKDLRRMAYWGIGVLGVLCLASVSMIISSDGAKEELEDDYEEE